MCIIPFDKIILHVVTFSIIVTRCIPEYDELPPYWDLNMYLACNHSNLAQAINPKSAHFLGGGADGAAPDERGKREGCN